VPTIHEKQTCSVYSTNTRDYFSGKYHIPPFSNLSWISVVRNPLVGSPGIYHKVKYSSSDEFKCILILYHDTKYLKEILRFRTYVLGFT